MRVIVAKNAGFCFGVKRAMDAVERALEKGPVYTFGPVIHNEAVVERLRNKGAVPVDSIESLKPGDTLVIRSHGVKPEVYAGCEKRGVQVIDATCPFVRRIHDIVSKASAEGKTVVILGEASHPEVIGINGWCSNNAVIISTPEEAGALLETADTSKSYILVSQTTMPQERFDAVAEILRNRIPDFVAQNTICETTRRRQKEAEEIAKQADAVLVVGGKNSSNTKKLADLCKKYCQNTVFVDGKADISLEKIAKNDIIYGVVAGASTPEWMIGEVLTHMSYLEEVKDDSLQAETPESIQDTAAVDIAPEAEEKKEETAAPEAAAPETDSPAPEEQSFEEAFEKTLRKISPGQIIKGTVVQISNDEVSVNIGYKSDGYIPKSEFSIDPEVNPADILNIGDEIEVCVLKVNDGEGNVVLSRKSLENEKAWENIASKVETKELLDARIQKTVKGGLIATVMGMQAFIPASQADIHFVDKLDTFVGTTVKVQIIEVDKAKKRVIASRRNAIIAENEKQKKELLKNIEVGSTIKGVVRRICEFGAFVDIGGVDGLLHITDMAWGKVKHPSDVVKVDEELELKVLNVDVERERISLGRKQLLPHPWETADERYPVGSVVEGKVVRIGPFGAFVYLEPTIDGLIHISQVATRRIEKVEDELQVGAAVRAKVLSIDKGKRRISLSRKQVILDEQKAARKAEEQEKKAAEEEVADEKVELPPVQQATVTLGALFPDMKKEFEE